MNTLLCDFVIQTDFQTSARQPVPVIVSKRIWRRVDFTIPADQREKIKESEKRDKYLDLARELKKTLWNSDSDRNRRWCT